MSVKRNDILWKGALEDFFADFLLMIFADAEEIFDFSQGFIFLDKELAEITQGDEIMDAKLIDKLAGVYLKAGGQLWVRVHVEVEKKAKKGFGRRMLRYFYRIWDKYDVPVVSIAVFLEKRTVNNEPFFNYSFHGTSVDFRFNAVYVAELDERELSKSDNPFAKLLLTAKIAIRKDLSVNDIFESKVAVARQLLALELPPDKTRKLMNFLKLYIPFEQKEITAKFDEEIKLLTNKTETMGIEEQIHEMIWQEGKTAGRDEGLLEGKAEVVKNLLQHTSHSITEIARLANVSEKFILGIRNGAMR